MIKNDNGVTMIMLVIIIVVLIIIAGITINYGIETQKEVMLKDKITILSMIKAKGMGYQEKVDFKAGFDGSKMENAISEVYETEASLVKIDNNAEVSKLDLPGGTHNYYVSKVALEKMGINKDAEEKEYVISFNDTNLTLEVYLVKGYGGCYSLTQLEGM